MTFKAHGAVVMHRLKSCISQGSVETLVRRVDLCVLKCCSYVRAEIHQNVTWFDKLIEKIKR